MAGALAPDVIIIYSKRWLMPGIQFDAVQYLTALGAYLLLAAIVAPIFPYKGRATEWKAFVVGICLPILIAGLLATQRQAIVSPRGIPISGTLLDLMSLF